MSLDKKGLTIVLFFILFFYPSNNTKTNDKMIVIKFKYTHEYLLYILSSYITRKQYKRKRVVIVTKTCNIWATIKILLS